MIKTVDYDHFSKKSNSEVDKNSERIIKDLLSIYSKNDSFFFFQDFLYMCLEKNILSNKFGFDFFHEMYFSVVENEKEMKLENIQHLLKLIGMRLEPSACDSSQQMLIHLKNEKLYFKDFKSFINRKFQSL